tara:strand:+ start:315 stop:1193 length:879 start_codon:yes stop_codon:yes gene_type:complete
MKSSSIKNLAKLLLAIQKNPLDSQNNYSHLKRFLGLSKYIDEIELCLKYLNQLSDIEFSKNEWFLDVGFHCGSSTRTVLKDSNLSIIAFEPNLKMIKNAPRKILASSRLKLFTKAISDKTGISDLFISDESTGISSLIKNERLHNQKIRIETDKLENILKVNNINPLKCRYAKIDVEGLELTILKQVLDIPELRPEIIISEFQDAKSGFNDLRNQIEICHKSGYSIILSVWKPIMRYGIPHEWERLIPINKDIDCTQLTNSLYSSWGNIIAVKDKRMENLLNFIAHPERLSN